MTNSQSDAHSNPVTWNEADGRLPTPEEAKVIAEAIKARMRRRSQRRMRYADLRRAAFSFSLFPELPEIDFKRHAERNWRDYWEQAGDRLRLAMMQWTIGEQDERN